MQIGWFVRVHAWVVQISADAHAWLYRQPVYLSIKKSIGKLRAWLGP
jgi:hypothetical protein